MAGVMCGARRFKSYVGIGRSEQDLTDRHHVDERSMGADTHGQEGSLALPSNILSRTKSTKIQTGTERAYSVPTVTDP